MTRKVTTMIIPLILLGFFLLIGGQFLISLYPEFMWFDIQGYRSVFTIMLFAKLAMFAVFTFVAMIFFFLNFLIARKVISHMDDDADIVSILLNKIFGKELYSYNPIVEGIKKFVYKSATLALLIFFGIVSAIIAGSQGYANWELVLKFINQVPSSVLDPIYQKSISFYFFSLPFYGLISNIVLIILFISIGVLLMLYFQFGMLRLSLKVFKSKQVKSHILILCAMFFFVLAFKFWLSRYGILFSGRNTLFFGAGYTDVHANILNYTLLTFLSVVTGLILIVDIFIPTFKPVLAAIVAIIASGFFFGGIYPELLQNFVVKPSEYEKEKAYIEHNINYTRKAYGLSDVSEKFFPAEQSLTINDIKKNKSIIDNIRLWDEAPLLKTFSQLQEIRSYYEFGSADVDRYYIDGKIQQVIVSVRELVGDQLSQKAQNFVNRKLQYTHGHGVVMSPVNKFTREGMPDFYIKNIPPVANEGFVVKRPEIYYGETKDDYVIVNTSLPEFDYPKGDDNKYNHYDGKGGLPIGSIFNRILFSIYYQNKNILFSSYIKKDSRILMHRNVMERVKTLAPFITYDSDPYIVLADGRLFWMIDGYTISNKYPYSQPYARNFNYIRNSVKVTIDAYSGAVNFYAMNNNDPIIGTYKKIYKDLFKPFMAMPESLKVHIRYPKDFFTVQAYMYRNYHMTNPQVFYNQEDLWEIPKERYEDNEISMEPYYITMKSPEEDKFEFLLMIPFTPANKNNLISWVVVKNDPHNYGEMSVYKLSKEKQIFGPMQIESRVDQDTMISQQLTLWGQKGSRVIRGNLLIIPIEDSLLYVEPIYLQATASKLPQLKRVVVSYGNKVVMEEDLDTAIAKIFGESYGFEDIKQKVTPKISIAKQSVKELADKALSAYNRAQKHLKDAKWAEYGKTLDELKRYLEKLVSIEKK